MANFCRHCAAKLGPEDKFCTACGAALERAASSNAAPSQISTPASDPRGHSDPDRHVDAGRRSKVLLLLLSGLAALALGVLFGAFIVRYRSAGSPTSAEIIGATESKLKAAASDSGNERSGAAPPAAGTIAASKSSSRAAGGNSGSTPIAGVRPNAQAAEAPPESDNLGTVWNEHESGWKGTWTRRGTSKVFDATWGDNQVTAVLTILIQGATVKVVRRNSSDGNDCDYQGVLAADGMTVSGTYICKAWVHGVPWGATIQNAIAVAPQPAPVRQTEDAQATWLGFANGNVAQDRDFELRRNCGDFKRVYVPENAGSNFNNLCGYLSRTCEKVCDWEGTGFPCSAVSLGGQRDGTRVALCR